MGILSIRITGHVASFAALGAGLAPAGGAHRLGGGVGSLR